MSSPAGEITEINFSLSSETPPDQREGWRYVTGIRSGWHIWTRSEPDSKPAITHLTIGYGDEVPYTENINWRRVDVDLANPPVTAGTSASGPEDKPRRPVYLYVASEMNSGAANVSPIVSLKIVTDRNPIAGPGFSKEGNVLNPDTPRTVAKEFLCYQTQASAAKAARELYRVGDILDVCDQSNEWRVARIIEVNEAKRQILVTFIGWSSKWDETHNFRSERLAPYRSKTRGSVTGWTGEVPPWNYDGKNAQNLQTHLDMFSFVPAQLADKKVELNEDDRVFLEGESTQMVKNILSIECDEKSFESPEKREEITNEIVKFFCTHIDLAIYQLLNVPTLLEDAMGNLTRILAADPRYRRFFKLFANFTPTDYEAVMKAGEPYVHPEPGAFAFDQRSSAPEPPRLAQYFVAYFGKQGGFDALRHAMKNTGVIFDFYGQIQFFNSLIKQSRISPDFVQQYVPTLGLEKLVPAKIAGISDSDLKVLNRAYFDSLFVATAEILAAASTSQGPKDPAKVHAEIVAPFVERSQLDVALRMLCADVLETRSSGLDQIEELAKVLLGAKVKKGAMKVLTLTRESLAKWIQENDILERVFGRDPHELLIKRIPYTLVLLASVQMLRPSDFSLFWRIATSERSAISRAGLSLLGEPVVLNALNEEYYAELQSKIAELSPESLSSPMIEFIAKYTDHATNKAVTHGEAEIPDEQLQLYGADYFWNLLFDDGISIHPSLRAEIQRTFTNSLCTSLGARRKRLFMRRCIANLKRPNSAALPGGSLSLQLLRDLILAGPTGAPQVTPATLSEYFVQMNNEFGLIDLLINDLESSVRLVSEAAAAKQAAEAQAQANAGYSGSNPEEAKHASLSPTYSVTSTATAAPSSTSVKSSVSGKSGSGNNNNDSDVEAVSMRAGFLGTLLQKSLLQLNVQQVDRLWNIFVKASVPLELRNFFFRWLNDIMGEYEINPDLIASANEKLNRGEPEMGVSGISVLAIVHLYETYCVHLKATDMTDAVLDLFLRLLVDVNSSLIATVNQFIVILRNELESLHGLDLLWQLAFYAPTQYLSARASALLVDLYARLAFNFPFTAKVARISQYVTKVLDTIKSNKAVLESPEATAEDKFVAERAIRRGINAIKSLIQNASRIIIGCASYPEGSEVRARWRDKKKIYGGRIRKVNMDGTYWVDYDDGDVDEHCPATNVVGFKDESLDTPENYTEALFALPANMITGDQERLEVFLSLVESSTDYPVLSTLALDLLSAAPYSSEFITKVAPGYIPQIDAYDDGEDAEADNADAMTPMSQEEWAKFFPANHCGRLMYTLKFIAKMMKTDAKKGAGVKLTQAEEQRIALAEMRRESFRRSFAARGGIHALANVLLTAPASEMVNSRVGLAALKEVLRLFDIFSRAPELQALYESVGGIDFAKLVPRALTLIDAAVGAKIPADVIASTKAGSSASNTTAAQTASSSASGFIGPQLPGTDFDYLGYGTQSGKSANGAVEGVTLKDDTDQLIADDQRSWVMAPGLLLRLASLFINRNWNRVPDVFIELIKGESNPQTEALFPIHRSWPSLFTAALVESPLSSLREAFSRAIMELLTTFQSDPVIGEQLARTAQNLFTKILLEMFPVVCARPAGDELIRYYFNLLDRLLQNAPADIVNFHTFGKAVLQKLLVHPIVERPGAGMKPKQQLDLSDYNATAAKGTVTSAWFNSSANSLPPAEEDAKRETEAGVDLVLVGLYNLARRALQLEPSLVSVYEAANIVDVIYKDIFELPVPDASSSGSSSKIVPPKCKSPHACRAAFELLAAYCRLKPQTMTKLVSMLAPFHQAPPRTTIYNAWSYSPQADETRTVPYVGLNNMGATCYINSTLQQLFMIPHFRKHLLEIELNTEPSTDGTVNPAADPKNELIVKSLRQLQLVVASLQESNLTAYNPASFIGTLTDSTGAPLNPCVQEDSATFMVRLIDNFNKILKGSPYEDHLNRSVGGVFANELIGMNTCPHARSRPDEFVTIPVEVRGMNTLEEALRAFVKPEMLEGSNGFRCDQCKAKVDTMKRLVIQHLPPTLCFQLKRFDMCYETFRTIKLDDRLEFPEIVNMKPYTVEGVPLDPRLKNHPGYVPGTVDGRPVEVRPDDYYLYKLRGVIVHYGTADGGHYYSYIQERLSREEEAQGKQGRWFEFNDSFVRPFDPKDLDEQTFGGTTATTVGGRVYHRANANAYMLFYDRIGETPPDDAPCFARSKSHAESKTSTKTATEVLSQVWQANQQQLRDRAVFNPAYFNFMADVSSSVFPEFVAEAQAELASANLSDADLVAGFANGVASETLSHYPKIKAFNEMLVFAFKFIFLTVARARRNESLVKWHEFFPRAIAERAATPFCAWLLTSLVARPNSNTEPGSPTSPTASTRASLNNRPWIYQIFLSCPTGELRQAFAAVVDAALKAVLPHELGQWKAAVELIRKRNLANGIVQPESDAEEAWLEEFHRTLDAAEAATPPDTSVRDRFLAEIERDLRETEQDAPGLALALWMIDNFREIGFTWRNSREYFLVLQNIVVLHPVCADLANQSNMLARACDLYIGDQSPLFSKSDIPLKHGRREKLTGIDVHYMISLIAHLAVRAPPHNRRTMLKKFKAMRADPEGFAAQHDRATRRAQGELLEDDNATNAATKAEATAIQERIQREYDTLLFNIHFNEQDDEAQARTVCLPPTLVPGHENCYAHTVDAAPCVSTYLRLMMDRYLHTRAQALQLQAPDAHFSFNNYIYSLNAVQIWTGFVRSQGPVALVRDTLTEIRALFRMYFPLAKLKDAFVKPRLRLMASKLFEVIQPHRTKWVVMDMFINLILRFAAISPDTYEALLAEPRFEQLLHDSPHYAHMPRPGAQTLPRQPGVIVYGADTAIPPYGKPMTVKIQLLDVMSKSPYEEFVKAFGELRRYPVDPESSAQTPTHYSPVATSSFMQEIVECDSDDESYKTIASAGDGVDPELD